MDTGIQILSFLIRVLGALYLSVILLRFLLQAARADFYNPLSQAIVKLTTPLLRPLRRVIPGFGGIDLASLVLALLFHYIVMQLLLMVVGYGWQPPGLMLVWSLIGISLNIITIYIFAGIVVAIASFIAPYSANPVLVLVRQLIQPLTAPIQRFLPSLGGLDFSLLFVFIGLQVLRMVINGFASSFGTPFPYLIGYT